MFSPNANSHENKEKAAGEPGRVQPPSAKILGVTKTLWRTGELSDRPTVTLQRFISLTKTMEHRACTRMSHGSNQEKHSEVTKISVFIVTRQRSSEGDQCTKSDDPKILPSKWVMRARLESNIVMTYWVTRTSIKKGEMFRQFCSTM